MNSKIKFIFIVVILSVLTFVVYIRQEEFKQQELGEEVLGRQESITELSEAFTMYIATDIHYLSPKLTDDKEAFKTFVESGDGKQLDYIEEIMDAFIYEIKENHPDALIISGDLTNNGEKESHLGLAQKLKEIEEGGTKVYVIPGNHDISNPWARKFEEDKQLVTETINEDEFVQIYKAFGYEEAYLRDKDSLSYVAIPTEDVWLLMLDTNQYKNNIKQGYPEASGEISKHTLKWIKECIQLAKEKGVQLIPVTHHSALNHSSKLQKKFTLNNYKALIRLYEEAEIPVNLSGHIHIQDISSYKNNGLEIYDIATSSLVVYPQQYGLLKYDAVKQAVHYSTAKIDIEGWAKKNKIIDPVLNDFNTYSEDFFGNLAYNMAYDQLIKLNNLTKQEVELMSATMKVLNVRFFAGEESLNETDPVIANGIKLWSKVPNNFLKRYVYSIIKDPDVKDNELTIYFK